MTLEASKGALEGIKVNPVGESAVLQFLCWRLTQTGDHSRKSHRRSKQQKSLVHFPSL